MDNQGYRDSTDHQAEAAKAAKTDAVKSAAEQRPVSDVEFGSGWYHDVAIKESEKPVSRKH